MVYIILVNWNGWRDTIECLESLFRLQYSPFRVIVCDNASADHSLDHIAAWAEGKILADCSSQILRPLSFPPIPKPVPYLRLERDGRIGLDTASLVLVQTGDNLGFAGANNVGLRLGLETGDLAYAWLLNNDTVVDPHALSHMVAKMESDPGVGLCGSTLVSYANPASIQALGGSKYEAWIARTWPIGTGLPIDRIPDPESVEKRMNCLVGASMLASRAFLEEIGLLNESYFLYFEEMEWAKRAAGRFQLGYCPGAIVYHKEGASIGTGGPEIRSVTSEFYSTRNRILFACRFNRRWLPLIFGAVLLSAFHRFLIGKSANGRAVLDGLRAGLAAAFLSSGTPAGDC